MDKKEHLDLPLEVAKWLDDARGPMTRTAFICHLLDLHTSTNLPYVTTEEFARFRDRVSTLLRRFLDLTIASMVGADSQPPHEPTRVLLDLLRASNGHQRKSNGHGRI